MAVMTTLLATPASAAIPAPSGAGGVDQGADSTVIVVTISASTDGSPGVVAADSPVLRSPIRYVANAVPYIPEDPDVALCTLGGGTRGWWFVITAYDTTTGHVVGAGERVCVPLDDQNVPAIPPPPALPEPPTIGEIWNAAAIAQPTLAASPTDVGVTGLETWLWATGPDTVTVATPALNGYVVTGTATRVGYTFDFGDGPVQSSETGGTEADPAARHTYETKGTYRVTVASVWEAAFTMTGPGFTDPVPIDVATAQVRTTRDYCVVEIRSTLVGDETPARPDTITC